MGYGTREPVNGTTSVAGAAPDEGLVTDRTAENT
jgi:hypothetical protein